MQKLLFRLPFPAVTHDLVGPLAMRDAFCRHEEQRKKCVSAHAKCARSAQLLSLCCVR
jgi:hypothetical protein